VTQPIVNPPPAGGTVSAQFTVSMPTVPGLQLTAGAIGLGHFDLFGDVSTTPEAQLHGATINAVTTSMGQTFSFPNLPQGVYSRLEFSVEHVWLTGSYMGVPLTVHDDNEGPRVDLRAMPPPELVDGDAVTLPIAVSSDTWWRDVDLSLAELDDGRILIDAFHNWELASAIMRDVGLSFAIGTPIQ
jgi:hypothetical protein